MAHFVSTSGKIILLKFQQLLCMNIIMTNPYICIALLCVYTYRNTLMIRIFHWNIFIRDKVFRQ